MTAFLLDTHVYLWWLEEPAKLTSAARAAIADRHYSVFVSAVSVVEIAIKQTIGKLDVEGLHEGRLVECQFSELPFTHAHAWAMTRLPLLHRDPFDRMLVAQAMQAGLTLVTRDRRLAEYGVPTLAA